MNSEWQEELTNIIKNHTYGYPKDSIIKSLDLLIQQYPAIWQIYLVKSEILLGFNDLDVALETSNAGIGYTNEVSLYYQKARILKEIDQQQAIEVYLYLLQIDHNAYPCIQLCLLTNEINQHIHYCNLYFEYHPVSINTIESAFAVFALLLDNYKKRPFDGFFLIVDKMNLASIANQVKSNTAEGIFLSTWKLIKNKNIDKAFDEYEKHFLTHFKNNYLLYHNHSINHHPYLYSCTYPFYGLNHVAYATTESIRNEYSIQQATPIYKSYGAILKIKNDFLEKVKDIFFHSIRWNVNRCIKVIEKDNEHYVSIHQDTDRWYTSYENIYITINLLAQYVEDAIFFIDEEYSVWVDEYNIQDGKVYFERRYAEEEYSDDKFNMLEKKISNRSELRNFFSMKYLPFIFTYSYKEDEYGFFFQKIAFEPKINLKLIEKSIKYNPENDQAWLAKGIAYQLLNKSEEAQSCFEKSIAINERNSASLLILSVDYFNHQKYEKALYYLNQLNDIVSNLKITHLIKGYIYSILNQENKVSIEFEKVFALSLAHYSNDKTIRLRTDVESYITKATDYHLIFLRYLNYIDEKLEKIAAQDLNSIRSIVSINCIEWAKWLCKDKNKEMQKIGFDFFDKALIYNTTNTQAYIEKANILKRTKKVKAKKEAKQLLEKLVSIDSENIEAISELYGLSMENKEYDKAIYYSSRYLELVGENASGYGNQSFILYGNIANAYYAKANELLYENEKYKEAEDGYDLVLNLYPKLSEEWKNFEGPWVGKSDAKTYQKNFQQALLYAETALSINSSSPYAWSAKASCLNNLGQYEEALVCCEKAIELKPDYYHPWYVKACIYALTSKVSEAIEMIKKVLQIDPKKNKIIKKEPDFTSLYTNKEFQYLIE